MDIKILEEMIHRKKNSLVISVNEFYYDSNNISNCVYETSIDLKVYSSYDEKHNNIDDTTFDLRDMNYILHLAGSSYDILNFINNSTYMSVHNHDLYIYVKRDYICTERGNLIKNGFF